MITFVLYKNSSHNFEGLVNPVFLFLPGDLYPGKFRMSEVRDKLECMLDKADPIRDRIVLNGPSYLVALAGMVWLTNDKRSCMNVMSYNTLTHKFEEHLDPI